MLNVINFERDPLRKTNYWTNEMSIWNQPCHTTIGTKQERGPKFKRAEQNSLTNSEKFQNRKTIQAFQEASRLCACME